jgi:hypothetical protein
MWQHLRPAKQAGEKPSTHRSPEGARFLVSALAPASLTLGRPPGRRLTIRPRLVHLTQRVRGSQARAPIHRRGLGLLMLRLHPGDLPRSATLSPCFQERGGTPLSAPCFTLKRGRQGISRCFSALWGCHVALSEVVRLRRRHAGALPGRLSEPRGVWSTHAPFRALRQHGESVAERGRSPGRRRNMRRPSPPTRAGAWRSAKSQALHERTRRGRMVSRRAGGRPSVRDAGCSARQEQQAPQAPHGTIPDPT